ncbi:MAG: NUDIX hydrolase [Actinomycetota bacterium]|nr:NUDIX hydrolase [Actinomycetota bacterium]
MAGSIELPPQLGEHARAFEDGQREPVEPRSAATVVLARDGQCHESGALELYFLRRVVGMAFAGGMAVFPGGGVDQRDFPDDAGDDIGWAGPPQQQWADRLGTDGALARALVCAAVRETYEESGVLLAGPTADTIVDDTTGEDWEADRVALEAREMSFTDFLRKRALLLRSDLLTPWACWVTPVFEPRRYRTWFFLARLPEGQRTRDVSTESSEVMWLSVGDALRQAGAKELLMLPPQYCTCLELYDVRDCDHAAELGVDRELWLVQPRAKFDGEAAHLEIPQRLVDLGVAVRSRLGR